MTKRQFKELFKILKNLPAIKLLEEKHNDVFPNKMVEFENEYYLIPFSQYSEVTEDRIYIGFYSEEKSPDRHYEIKFVDQGFFVPHSETKCSIMQINIDGNLDLWYCINGVYFTDEQFTVEKNKKSLKAKIESL